jgi:ribosomal protein S18 acetylase RimI-like enzyme
MTRNTEEITKEQQELWYKNLDKENNKLFLVNEILHGAIVFTIGYAYLRVEDDSVLLTGGLNGVDRGKGYGSKLFELLLQQAKQFKLPIKLEVLKTNMRAFVIYNNLGFRVVYDDGKLIKMEYYND